LLLVLLAGCATPVSHTNIPLSTFDKDTEYGIESRSNGFAVTVYYLRYQFIPESNAVATACKSQLTAIAWDHSDKIGNPIKQINEQRIRLSICDGKTVTEAGSAAMVTRLETIFRQRRCCNWKIEARIIANMIT